MSKTIANFSGTNFAGYNPQRRGYMQLAALAHIIQDRPGDVASSIIGALNNSPYTQINSFRKWGMKRANVSFMGQIMEAIDLSPNLTGPDFPYAFPIVLDAALEWLWMDSWYRPRMGFTWNPGFDSTRHSSGRITHGLGTVLAYRGPANWTFWAKEYWNTHTGSSPTEREKPWKGSFNKTTGEINIVSPGNWSHTFNPGIDQSAEYLYLRYDLQWFVYKIGSGDAILESVASAAISLPDSGYYPQIPVYVNSFSVTEVSSDLGAQANKAYKKISGTNIPELIDKIEEDPDSGQIDLASILIGVQASSPKKFCREYIYRYCANLRARAGNPTGAFKVSLLNDTVQPGSWASETGYRMYFKSMVETSGSGLRTPTSEVGSFEWEVSGEFARLHWQVSSTEWKTMSIEGAISSLPGLPGDGAKVSLWSVVNSTEDVGFIFPLHEPTLKQMSRLKAIEICQEVMNLIVGSYTLINTSSLLGGILFFIAATLLVAFPPSAAGVGLLGTNAAVGTAVGFAGSAAVLAGFVVNAVAAIIVMKIITKTSVLVFGDKLGSLIGAVVGFATVTVGTGLMNGQNMSSIWNSLGSATNIMALTNAVGSGMSGYISAAINDIQAELADLEESYDTKSKELQQAYADNLGYANSIFDPMGLTNSPLGYSLESPTQFINRTLLTGSDIADISLGMITNFADLTLSTELPG